MTRSNFARSSTLLAELFSPSTVATSELRGTADPAMLLPEEAVACASFRLRRLEEFAAGRLCARRALSEFGFGGFAVRCNADRSPQWPDDFVGSITHTIGFCGAVVGMRERFAGVGIDAEIVARVTRDIWSQAFTEDEIAGMSGLTPADSDWTAAVIFSAKEAFYKCQSVVTGAWLDYCDVNVELVPETDGSGAFHIQAATENARRIFAGFITCGRYRVTDALAVTGVAFTPSDVQAFTSRQLRVAS